MSVEKESVFKLIEKYKNEKSKMTNEQKEKNLRSLLSLSKKYNIDLRSCLEEKKSSILENDNILKEQLLNRYENCSFELDNYDLEEEDKIKSILEVAYYRVLAKLTINKATEDNKNIIESLINLDNIEFDTQDKYPTICRYNNYDFNTIKDNINVLIPEVSNSLKKYIEEKNTLFIEFKKSINYLIDIIND